MSKYKRIPLNQINLYNFDNKKKYNNVHHINLLDNKINYNYDDVNSYSVEALANLIEFDIPFFKCSRMYLYYNERLLLSNSNYDCILKLAIDNVKIFGCCSDNDWSYDLKEINNKPPINCYQKAKSFCSFDFYNIYNDINSIKKSLINNEPFITAINIYEDISNTDVITVPNNNDNEPIDSPIIFVYGYDDSKNMFLIKIKNKKYYLPYLYFLSNENCGDLWILTIRYYNVDLITQSSEALITLNHDNIANTTNIDLRSKFGPIFNQGKLGSCSANALCAIFNYDIPKFTGSRLFLYYNERKLENDIADDIGSTLSNGIICLKTYGICSETDWPYDITKFAIQPSETCYNNAKKYYLIDALNINNDLNSIKTCLINNEPIALGIQIYNSFETKSVQLSGLPPMPSSNDISLGGHAVVLCGFDDTKQLFILRNSWGINWGDKGYFYLPYNYILDNNLASQFWIIRKINL